MNKRTEAPRQAENRTNLPPELVAVLDQFIAARMACYTAPDVSELERLRIFASEKRAGARLLDVIEELYADGPRRLQIGGGR